MTAEQVASVIQNHISAGLKGVGNFTYSLDQLIDEVIIERLTILKELSLKGALPARELMQKITCIPTDCKDLAKCCKGPNSIRPTIHFEIPRISTVYGNEAVGFIGAIDISRDFDIYLDTSFRHHSYRRYGSKNPMVYIDLTANENNKLDGFVFNVPLLKWITMEAIWLDPYDLQQYACCKVVDFDPTGFITEQVIRRLTEKYIRYYRQLNYPPVPNTQTSSV